MIISSLLQQRPKGRMTVGLLSLILLVSVSTLYFVNSAKVERVMGSSSEEYATATRPVSTSTATRRSSSSSNSRRTTASVTTSFSDEENYDASAYEDLLSTREEILATREHRKQRLYTMIHDMEHQIQQDLIGRRMLAYGERVTLEKRLNAYRKKLETLEPELDDRVSDPLDNLCVLCETRVCR